MEHIKQTAPKCRECRHPDNEDPKRLMAFMQDDFNDNREVVHIHCPTIRCGNGWFIEVMGEKIAWPEKP